MKRQFAVNERALGEGLQLLLRLDDAIDDEVRKGSLAHEQLVVLESI